MGMRTTAAVILRVASACLGVLSCGGIAASVDDAGAAADEGRPESGDASIEADAMGADVTVDTGSLEPDGPVVIIPLDGPCGPTTCPEGCCQQRGQMDQVFCVAQPSNEGCGTGGTLCTGCFPP